MDSTQALIELEDPALTATSLVPGRFLLRGQDEADEPAGADPEFVGPGAAADAADR